jgi:hypothetical protein
MTAAFKPRRLTKNEFYSLPIDEKLRIHAEGLAPLHVVQPGRPGRPKGSSSKGELVNRRGMPRRGSNPKDGKDYLHEVLCRPATINPIDALVRYQSNDNPSIAFEATQTLARLMVRPMSPGEERAAIDLPPLESPESCVQALDLVVAASAAGKLPSRQSEALANLINLKLKAFESVTLAARITEIERSMADNPRVINGNSHGYQLAQQNEAPDDPQQDFTQPN